MSIRASSITLCLAMIGSIILITCTIDNAPREKLSQKPNVEFVHGDLTSTLPGWDFDAPMFQEGQGGIRASRYGEVKS